MSSLRGLNDENSHGKVQNVREHSSAVKLAPPSMERPKRNSQAALWKLVHVT
jgi:hypothetical protein